MAEHSKGVALAATTDLGLLEKTRPLLDLDKQDDYNHTSHIHEYRTDHLEVETFLKFSLNPFDRFAPPSPLP